MGPQARHGTYYAALALRPGSRGIVTDAAVPISKLAEVIEATAADVDASGVVGPVFGHAGDGNFHCILLSHPDDPPEYTERLRARLRQRWTALRRHSHQATTRPPEQATTRPPEGCMHPKA